MPMPRWVGRINKRVWNPRAIENGKWTVISHVGRSTGRTYRTPLGGVEVDGTFVFILVYGSRCDWAQNVLAAGSASVEHGGEVIELESPRIISREAAEPLLDGRAKMPPAFLNVDEYLQMDITARRPVEQVLPSVGA